MARDLVGIKRETGLALAAFLVAALSHFSPGIILLVGGLVGIVLFRQREKKDTP